MAREFGLYNLSIVGVGGYPYGGLVSFCKCAKNIWKVSSLSYHEVFLNMRYLLVYHFF